MIGYGEVSSPSSFCFGSRKKFQWKSIVSRTLLLCVDIKATTTRNTEIETYWQNLLLKIGSGRSSKMRKFVFFSLFHLNIFTFVFFPAALAFFTIWRERIIVRWHCELREACTKSICQRKFFISFGVFMKGAKIGRARVNEFAMRQPWQREGIEKNCTCKYLLGWSKNTQIRCKHANVMRTTGIAAKRETDRLLKNRTTVKLNF